MRKRKDSVVVVTIGAVLDQRGTVGTANINFESLHRIYFPHAAVPSQYRREEAEVNSQTALRRGGSPSCAGTGTGFAT